MMHLQISVGTWQIDIPLAKVSHMTKPAISRERKYRNATKGTAALMTMNIYILFSYRKEE